MRLPFFLELKSLLVFLALLPTVGLAEGRQYKIVTTIGMITDVVRNIAGEHAKVEGLIGEAVDPHLYKPTRNDVVKLQAADLVFYNGLLLEGKMNDILIRMAGKGKRIVPVTERIAEEPDYVIDGPESHYDPHVWMDVGGWMKAAEVIGETLAEYDKEHGDEYRQNAAAYISRLKDLHSYAKWALSLVPESQRVLITAHDAFNYFGRAYGVQVRGIQGISTESEAGVRDIENLVSFIIERDIRAVFVETSVADKNVRALVEGTRARGHQISIGGSLFSDAMGKSGTYEGTYIGMIDHNVTVVARSLGGKGVPEGGFREYLKSKS